MEKERNRRKIVAFSVDYRLKHNIKKLFKDLSSHQYEVKLLTEEELNRLNIKGGKPKSLHTLFEIIYPPNVDPYKGICIQVPN